MSLDPTAALITIPGVPTFGSSDIPVPAPPPAYSTTQEPFIETSILLEDVKDVENLPPTLLTDPSIYTRLQEKRRFLTGYPPEKYRLARDESNPYEGLGNNIFMNRAGLKIAAIDAIYNLTYHVGGLMHLTTPTGFKYADLAGAPGAFTQYVQWRRPESMGYGISLREESPVSGEVIPTWNLDLLDPSRFFPYYGPSGTGNLYFEWSSFVKRVRDEQTQGLDLVMGDGGFDVESDNSRHRQEFLSSRLIIAQLLTALKLLTDGGNFVLKVFDTVTELSAQILYIAALCFDSISLFKPISSRPANAEKYLVCQGKRRGTQRYELILEEVNSSYNEGENVVSMMRVEYPEDFLAWLIGMNDALVGEQDRNVDLITSRLSNPESITKTPRMNLNKALLLWNLPGYPITRASKIKIPGAGRGVPISASRGYPHY